MKHLSTLYNECVAMLDAIRMDYSRDIRNVTVNKRLTVALGQCVFHRREKYYDIQISPRILEDHIPDTFTRDTILHELLHTCPGCTNHGPNWQRRAERVNRAYGYRISTTASIEDCQKAGLSVQSRSERANYRIICPECGVVAYRMRRCDLTDNIGRYRCSTCKSHLTVESNDTITRISHKSEN